MIEDSAQGNALAAVANCSGGVFEVEWRGNIVVTQPFQVVNGTTLTITGNGSGATICGDAATRLFTVINATLRLNHVDISSGASVAGGAIAAAGAILVFNQTNFLSNSAAGNGGAAFVSDGSMVTCLGGGTFADNKADFNGGAMFVAGGSTVSCAAS